MALGRDIAAGQLQDLPVPLLSQNPLRGLPPPIAPERLHKLVLQTVSQVEPLSKRTVMRPGMMGRLHGDDSRVNRCNEGQERTWEMELSTGISFSYSLMSKLVMPALMVLALFSSHQIIILS